jgi:hypothetical protein
MIKKIILTIIALISINLLSAQTSFVRAYELNIGYKNSYGKIDWSPTPTSVDILIKAESSKVTIYSKRTQVYRIVKLLNQNETKSMWLCNDDNGVVCNVFILISSNKPGVLFVGVEYSDVTWFYSTTAE